MAQFRSSAREGSFKANQINVPNEVQKLQNEANRRIAGMNAVQAQMEKNRAVFLRAQEVANKLTNQGARVANDIEQDNYDIKRKNTQQRWASELKQDENRSKERAATYKQLENFSKTAFNITKGIIENNKENFLKAKNQIALTNNLDSETLNQISQLDREMSFAEYQRTEFVQQALARGESQDFIKVTYDHLLKGGGYTNYIENAYVLKNTGIKDGQQFQEILGDTSLKPEEKRRKIAQLKSQLVANLTVNGRVPSAELLAEHYFPAINAAQKEADRFINGEVRDAVAFETTNTRIQLLGNAYINDGKQKNPQAAWTIFQQNPTKEGRIELTNVLLGLGTLEDNKKLATTKFPGPNGTMVTLMDYPETAQLIDRAIDAKQRERTEQYNTAVKLEYAEREFELQQMVEAAYGDKDGLTQSELLQLQQYSANKFGAQHDSNVLKLAAENTIDKLAIPVLTEALDEYVESGNASLRGLEQFGTMPRSIKDKYTDIINKQSKLRNSSEYTDALKNFDNTIKGTIKSVRNVDYVQGGYNSPDVLWYHQKQKEKFIERLKRYSVTTPDPAEAIRLAEQETILSIEKELSATGAVSLQGGIKEFRDLLKQDQNRIIKAQHDANELNGFVKTKQARSPEGWIQFYQGTEEIIEATEQLQRGEPSPFFEQLGRKIWPSEPKAAWEVQAWFAPAVEGMEAIKPPETFEAIKDRLTGADRRSLFGDTAATQEKIRILREAAGETQLPVRPSYQTAQKGDIVGSFPVERTGTGTAPSSHTDALMDVAATLGVSPIDLATIIGFETGGTYDPGEVGGEGDNYQGLIQFGISERGTYGVVPGMTFEEQLRGPVLRYFQDRFRGAGWDTQGATLEDLYTTVIAGNPGANRDAKDSFGTSARSGVAGMDGHRAAAMKRFGLTQFK